MISKQQKSLSKLFIFKIKNELKEVLNKIDTEKIFNEMHAYKK